MEHESADLKFLNNQYVQKMKQLEKESKLKSDKIVQLQEKNFQAVVQTPGKYNMHLCMDSMLLRRLIIYSYIDVILLVYH